MKTFLLTAIIVLSGTSGFCENSWKDSLSDRRLIIKSSLSPIYDLYSSSSHFDIGAEITLWGPFTFDADVGFYYSSLLNQAGETSSGYFTNAAIRFYPNQEKLPYYLATQYRYQHQKSSIQVDFTEAGYPYNKLIDADRHSSFFYLVTGMTRNLFWKRLYFDYFFGLGMEYRIAQLDGLTGFEQDAINTGLVDGTEHDAPEGSFLMAWMFGGKIGFRIF